MEPPERLKELILELAATLNDVFNENWRIRRAIQNIEEEGYQVDLVLASITRIFKRNEETGDTELKFEFNAFDKEFLKRMGLRIDPPQERGTP